MLNPFYEPAIFLPIAQINLPKSLGTESSATTGSTIPGNPPTPTTPTPDPAPTTTNPDVVDTMLTMTYTHFNLPPSEYLSDDPSDEGQAVVSYQEGTIYVSKGSNGSHQFLGARGTVGKSDFTLGSWSFHMIAWYSWRTNYYDSNYGWVAWAGGYPTIQLRTTAGTPPSTFYIKFGDIKYTMTRQANVNGNMIFHDQSKGYNNGYQYADKSTGFSVSLKPF